jgi:hypothetical protein
MYLVNFNPIKEGMVMKIIDLSVLLESDHPSDYPGTIDNYITV